MKNLKYLIIVILLSLSACSETDLVEDNSESSQTNEPIPYYPSNENFVCTWIKYSDILGEWKLIDAKFYCALGEINKIEEKYNIKDEEKYMVFGESDFSKICFSWDPEFDHGVHDKIMEDTIKKFVWSPANGAPQCIVEVNYTDTILTLRYGSELFIDKKLYKGNVIESYIKK